MNRFSVVLIVILFIVNLFEEVQASWVFELFGGTVYNFSTPLTVRQSGYGDIKLDARYKTKPFEPPVYYVLRIGMGKDNGAWELELIHHKLFLKNEPPEIQRFSITHGYNLLTVNRAWRRKGIIFHLGAGFILAHPETTVRNKKHSEHKGIFKIGYYFTGPVAQLAVEKRFNFLGKLFIAVEGKLTGSFAHIPIRDGNADAPNVSIHGLFGLGYHFN